MSAHRGGNVCHRARPAPGRDVEDIHAAVVRGVLSPANYNDLATKKRSQSERDNRVEGRPSSQDEDVATVSSLR